jgi:hypothetical protein
MEVMMIPPILQRDFNQIRLSVDNLIKVSRKVSPVILYVILLRTKKKPVFLLVFCFVFRPTTYVATSWICNSIPMSIYTITHAPTVTCAA